MRGESAGSQEKAIKKKARSSRSRVITSSREQAVAERKDPGHGMGVREQGESRNKRLLSHTLITRFCSESATADDYRAAGFPPILSSKIASKSVHSAARQPRLLP